MIKTVIFDLDDTLYPEITFVKSGFWAVSEYMAQNYSVDDNAFFNLLMKTLKESGRGKIFDNVLGHFHMLSEELVKKLIDIYRFHRPQIVLYEDVLPILKTLKEKGTGLGIITDGHRDVQRSKVSALGIAGLFDIIIYTDDYGVEHWKPDALPFKTALKFFKVQAEEVVYVGDNPEKDFVGARKLGIKTVRIMKGNYCSIQARDNSYDGDYKICSVPEIMKIIEL